MKLISRLIILLLAVGCDNSTAPEPEDCAGVSGGNSVEDIDGNCYSTVQIYLTRTNKLPI